MKTAIARIILLCAATAPMLPAAAQSLKKEINVRHESAPERIDSRRLPINPLITLPQSKAHNLRYSSRDVSIDIPESLTPLAPTSYGDTLPSSPFRGYASLGFMAAYNLDVSAGYRFFDTDRTRLNAWLQYNGTAYRPDETNDYVRRHTATVGANLHRAVGRESYVDASLDYTFARYNTLPLSLELDRLGRFSYQTAHRFNASALWSINRADFFGGLGAGFSRFSYADQVPYIGNITGGNAGQAAAAAENVVRVLATLGGTAGDSQRLGIDMDLSVVCNSPSSLLTWGWMTSQPEMTMIISGGRDSWKHGLATFAPYYRFSVNSFDLNLGALVQLTINSGKAFHIAPNASATWRPVADFNLYVKARGGEVQNTLASLYDVSPYTTSLLNYGNSHVPLTAEAGFTIGPWRGGYVGLSATYARANDWLMPASGPDGCIGTWFQPVNMRGYKIAVSAGYTYRSLIALSLRGEMAPQKYDSGYYLWRDRARYVVDADVTVTPIRPLDVTLGWSFRARRSQALIWGERTSAETEPQIQARLVPLGSLSDLHLRANYRFNTRWSAFASASNLLNRNYSLIGLMPAQGITGLVGANYNF